jgi:hypothetical protein
MKNIDIRRNCFEKLNKFSFVKIYESYVFSDFSYKLYFEYILKYRINHIYGELMFNSFYTIRNIVCRNNLFRNEEMTYIMSNRYAIRK